MIERLIEVSVFIIATLISLWVGVRLRHEAKAHERTAQALGEKIARAIHPQP